MKFHDIFLYDIFLHDIRSYNKKKVFVVESLIHIQVCRHNTYIYVSIILCCLYLPFMRSLTVGSLLHRHECLLEKHLFMYQYMVTAS